LEGRKGGIRGGGKDSWVRKEAGSLIIGRGERNPQENIHLTGGRGGSARGRKGGGGGGRQKGGNQEGEFGVCVKRKELETLSKGGKGEASWDGILGQVSIILLARGKRAGQVEGGDLGGNRKHALPGDFRGKKERKEGRGERKKSFGQGEKDV